MGHSRSHAGRAQRHWRSRLYLPDQSVNQFRALRPGRFLTLAGACLLLANCASSDKLSRRVDPKYGVSASPRVVDFDEAVPRGGGVYRVGRPYTVAGRMYVPEENPHYRAEGMASWYGDDFHGRRTANGEVFDMTSISAAHPTLPLPSYARVTNVSNGKSLIVRVNDRGPYHGNRVIDVSHRAARLLEFHGHGVARVRVEYVGRAPLEGSDDRQLVATLRSGQPAPPPSAVMVASAKPFIPEATASAAMRGDVPLPAGRPYDLGRTSDDLIASAAVSELSGARQRTAQGQFPVRQASYQPAEEEAPRAATARPAAAYAPSGSGVLSGRGLY
ncbi:MAG: septal ring lytic transglycosylase RlpA family protein [Xanthobacteraceae bacterium]|nr:MAG: septal ring lytic transglycosylase RlpA family protein [Xanthobacteraceae bacterium]